MKKGLMSVAMGMGILGLMATRSMAVNGEHHLDKAKHHLEEALREMENASNGAEQYHGDKGRAEQGVRAAIEETQKAIDWAKAHPSQKVISQ